MGEQTKQTFIKDVLERIKQTGLEATAKELYVARDRLRDFLKENECEHIRGTREWSYKGDNSNGFLEWNLYEHVEEIQIRGTKPKSKQVKQVNKSNKTDNKDVTKVDNIESKEVKQSSEVEKKKVTYELPVELHEEFRIMAIKERKTVSQIVEIAMQQYLKENQ